MRKPWLPVRWLDWFGRARDAFDIAVALPAILAVALTWLFVWWSSLTSGDKHLIAWLSSLMIFAIAALIVSMRRSRAANSTPEAPRPDPKPTTAEPTAAQPSAAEQAMRRAHHLRTSQRIVGLEFRITELLTDLDFRVTGRTFERCKLMGPAVVSLKGQSRLENTMISTDTDGNADKNFIALSKRDWNRGVVGVVTFLGCHVNYCTFVGVSFIGSKADVDRMRAQTPVHPDSQ